MSWRDIGYAVVMAVAGAIAFTTVIDVGRIAVRFWHQPAVVSAPHPQQKIVTPILWSSQCGMCLSQLISSLGHAFPTQGPVHRNPSRHTQPAGVLLKMIFEAASVGGLIDLQRESPRYSQVFPQAYRPNL
jgi:hypothetical protein